MTIGSNAHYAEGVRLRADRAGESNVGWAYWLFAAGDDGRILTFANRDLGHGVTLLGEGLLPLAGVRAGGWRLAATGVPVSAIVAPPWLIREFRGRWSKAAR